MASLGQLTSGIPHGIKHPLNFVNNFATLSVDLLGRLSKRRHQALRCWTRPAVPRLIDLTNTLASNLDKINEHGRRADGIERSMLEHSEGPARGDRLTLTPLSMMR